MGEKNFKDGKVEFKLRRDKDFELLDKAAVFDKVVNTVKAAKSLQRRPLWASQDRNAIKNKVFL